MGIDHFFSKGKISFLFLILIIVIGIFAYAGRGNPSISEITFGEGSLPYVEVSVGGKKKQALLDLGTSFVSIDSDLIEEKLATPTGFKHIRKSPLVESEDLEIYQISEISLGILARKNILALAPRPHVGVDFGSGEPFVEGYSPLTLGRSFFKGSIVIVDFKNKQLLLIDSMSHFKHTPYARYRPRKLKAEFDGLGILISDEVGGLYALDTGSTLNFVKDKFPHDQGEAYHISTVASTFSNDFPSTGSFYKANFFFPDKVDGILGIPFFMRNVVMYDFIENEVYVLTSE